MQKLFFIFIIFVASISTCWAGKIGIATDVEGDVQILRGDHYYQALKGVEFEDSDALITGKDSKIQIDMIDGTNLLVGASTRLRFSEYVLDENNNVVSAVVDVVSGWLRFAVAKLNESSTYSIDTPTMTIGIRGTEGVIEAGEEKNGLFLEEGNVDVYEVGAESSAAAPLALAAGQYAEQLRGQRLRRRIIQRHLMSQRIPARLRARLERRAHLLASRSVSPRMIRAARRQELRQFLLKNPEVRKKLRKRFRKAIEIRRELRRKRFKKFKNRLRNRFRQG